MIKTNLQNYKKYPFNDLLSLLLFVAGSFILYILIHLF